MHESGNYCTSLQTFGFADLSNLSYFCTYVVASHCGFNLCYPSDLCSLVIYASPPVKDLFTYLTHFIFLVFLSLIYRSSLHILGTSPWSDIFIFYKYFIPVCGLTVHFLNDVF